MVKTTNLFKQDLIPEKVYPINQPFTNYLKDEVISKLFNMKHYGFKRGIGNQSGIRRTMVEYNQKLKNEEAFVVLVNSRREKEYRNIFDDSSNILTYYGDNRDPNKHYLDTKQKGNQALRKYFNRYKGNIYEKHLAPFFYFERFKNYDMQFKGIAVPLVKEIGFDKPLQLHEFKIEESTYMNYVVKFMVLQVTVSREWLIDLKQGKVLTENTPNEWINYIENNTLRKNDFVFETDVNQKNNNYDKNIEHVGEALSKYRKTQNIFRDFLIKERKSCEVCNLDIPELLIASHIIPWSMSNNEMKIDPDNGLLLCTSHDALFDKGFISFDDNGNIIISEILKTGYYKHLNINPDIRIELNENQKQYLKEHRKLLK